MQTQSTVTISNVHAKKKSKGVLNSLALLTNKDFQVMHMLQLHVLFVLYWPGMLEPALHLVCVRPPRTPRKTQLQVQAGFPRLIYISKQKRPESLIWSKGKPTQAYTFMPMLFLPSNSSGCTLTLSVGNSLG